MAGELARRGYKVVFAPDRREVVVAEGSTVLDACQAAGIPIDSVCDGKGKCGRCKVRITGSYSADESALLTESERREGIVLACLAKPQGDVRVHVLPRSRLTRHQILTTTVEEVPEPITPWSSKVFVEVPEATLADNTADMERLMRTLGKRSLSVTLEALRELPDAIRKGGWKVTITLSGLSGEPEIVRVDPGDTRSRLLGIAVDIGTTTVVVELVDLLSGKVLGTASDYNRQISRGEDVIARMMHSEEKGVEELSSLAKETINSCIASLLAGESARSGVEIPARDICSASVAGNTVMTHFFAGLSTNHVRLEPYVPVAHHLPQQSAGDLSLLMNPAGKVLLFPSRAGYVGGDIVADVLASGMHRSKNLSLLIDVGTNGEVVLGGKEWMMACSCSAGPAFEGAEVSCGMRAMEGAIDRMRINDDLSTSYHVIGDGAPLGICGSGLIDLISEMFTHGIIDRKARIQELGDGRTRPSESGLEFVVERGPKLGGGGAADMVITDADLQNLIRTKAAIYGACAVLLRKTGESLEDLSRVFIAGGFGYHLDIERAISIGMFPDLPRKKYRFIGNGALGGARLALLSKKRRKEAEDIFERMTYLELSVDNEFYDEFSSSLFLPHTDTSKFPSVGGSGGKA
ncbi:MAG: DUF4445 domain-containing protein [Candidatus Thermoplasmatota archaeon]|nr:DUF4445 domain-containing protein [Candidatus Thermoplasmatota archaeon]